MLEQQLSASQATMLHNNPLKSALEKNEMNFFFFFAIYQNK